MLELKIDRLSPNMNTIRGHGLDMQQNENQYRTSYWMHFYPKEISIKNFPDLGVECIEMQW